MFVSACATGPVPVDPERVDRSVQAGALDVHPPHGPNWVAMVQGGPDTCLVVYHKLLPDRAQQAARGHTYAATAHCGAVPGGRRFANAQEFANFNTERITASAAASTRHVLRHWEAVPDPDRGPLCVRYAVEEEDRGVPGWGRTMFLLTAHGYRCVHPHDPAIVVDVNVSERRLPEDAPWSLDGEVQPFLAGVGFRAAR